MTFRKLKNPLAEPMVKRRQRWRIPRLLMGGILGVFLGVIIIMLFRPVSTPYPLLTGAGSPKLYHFTVQEPAKNWSYWSERFADNFPGLSQGSTEFSDQPFPPFYATQWRDLVAPALTDPTVEGTLNFFSTIEMYTAFEAQQGYLATVGIQGINNPDQEPSEKPTALSNFTDQTRAPVIVEKKIKAGRMLRARMTSGDLEFTEQERGWKWVSDDSPSIWTWKIQSGDAGRKSLTFVIEQQVLANGERVPVGVTQFPYEVDVTVGWLSWLMSWPSLVGGWIGSHINELASVVAIVGGVLAGIKWGLPLILRRKPESPITQNFEDGR